MPHINIEFKARVQDLQQAEDKLIKLNPRLSGTDEQTDTYFNVPNGRLKLREGNIENALIFYERENAAGSKQSNVLLYTHQPSAALRNILTKAYGIKTIVKKIRRIYFIDNVKFHFDTVPGLGTFIETEAIDSNGTIGKEKLQQQCDEYIQLFEIKPDDFIAVSYSDMMP